MQDTRQFTKWTPAGKAKVRKQVNIRLTEREYNRLYKSAVAAKMTMNAYIISKLGK